MAEDGDKWARIADLYKEKFENAFSQMRLQYDSNEDGSITGEEEGHSPTSVFIGRA